MLLSKRNPLVLTWLMVCVISSPSSAKPRQAPTENPDRGGLTQSVDTTTASPTQPPKESTGHPLAVDEDPAMIGKRNLNKGVISKMSMSLEKEVALGRQLATEVDRQSKFVDDPVITEYVNRVAQNLVLHSDAKIPFTVKVIDSDEVNAFALPGGFFYVNKGLILAADNEAELAGVMAHEISHVIARHAVENQSKANLMQYGALAGMIFMGGIPGLVLQNTAGLGLMLSYMKFSRSAEAEADRLGLQYLYASGYDPTALAAMFEKLESQNKKKPGTISKLFADHPAPIERRQASLALAARFPTRDEYVVSTSEFQRVKARLLKLSNARALVAAGDTTDPNGSAGRPTLRRRDTVPNSSGTTTDAADKSENQPGETGPPKLKRKEGEGGQQGQPPSLPAEP